MSKVDRDRLKSFIKADAIFIFNRNQNTILIVNTRSMKQKIDANNIATESSQGIMRRSNLLMNELNDNQKHQITKKSILLS